jgi:hypothetical protein
MAQEHSFADFGLHSILTVEMPSPGMTVPGVRRAKAAFSSG